MEKQTIKRILGYVRPYWVLVLLSLLCAACSAGAQLLIPIFTGDVLDLLIGPGQVQWEALPALLVYIAVAAVSAAIAQQALAVCNNRITFSICRDLRNKVSQKLQKLPLSYLDTHPSGDLVSRMVGDVDTFADGLLMGFTQLFTGVITILGTLIIMLSLNPWITAIVVLLTPMSFFVTGFIAKRTHKHFQQQAKERGTQTALINELMEGQRVVKAYGHEDESLRDFDAVNDRLSAAALNATFFSSLTNPSTRLVNNIVYAAVALVGALFVGPGGITIGKLSIFLSYASQYAKPFNEISGVVTELQNSVTCARRVFELLDEKEETPDTDDVPDPALMGRVELQDVDFSYVPEKPLIQNLNLQVQPGQRIAIVGPTGCGKTTLINLLMRFYDVKDGAILAAGKDIRRISRKSLRGCYGMVLQDTWLKAGTVRENIAYGAPEATEEEIVAAAKAAHAHGFIRRLPNGYDTMIAENGENLSAGQRQLLCIARAMLKLPPMLILDEATSSIDTRTELKIQDAFSRMMQGRTSFIVAHRLSTIRSADVILVMRNGSVIEQGSHRELMKQNGFYASLYNSQFTGV
ncbi:MAG: ABC transporter ATP-binding protein [Oscillospiraceae bacterium]|nr:ABC transporter ATP-binding protein [Oscillospiraceae bacterium]